MAFRGDWTPGVAYVAGDSVMYNGNIFHTNVGTVAGSPPPAQDSNQWILAFGKEQDTDLQFLIQSIFPGYIKGKPYVMYDGNTSATALNAVDTIYLYPFTVRGVLPFVSAQIQVTTGGAGSSVKTAIWANSPLSARPLGAPLFADNTGVATTATAVTAIGLGPGILLPGKYWFGIKATGTLPSLRSGQNVFSDIPVNGTNLATLCFSFADAYANAMPTFAEAASFTSTSFAPPLLQLTL